MLVPLAICFLAVVIGTLLIFLIIYVGSNSVGTPYIFGVQGRYFLPFLPPIAVCLGLATRQPAKFNAIGGIVFFSIAVLAEAVMDYSLLVRYWCT